MVLEMPAVPAIPEFISVPECDDSCPDVDAGFAPRRARYFSGILATQACSREKEEVMLYGDDDGEGEDGEDYELNVTPENQSLRDYLFQIMPPEWRKEIENSLVPDAEKDEDVEIPSPWPKGYETPDARLKLLQREVKMLCHGNGFLNVDKLKPESQDFVDGVLDCAFEVAMGRCAMAEAKAAKRRAKRHRKREMANLRRCMDRKRKLEDYDDIIHRRAAPVEGVIDAKIAELAELKAETCIDVQVKEEVVENNEQIKEELTFADGGKAGKLDVSISISREPCSAEEISAKQRELLIEFDGDDDGDSSEEAFMDTCPQDDSMRSSSL